MHLMVLISFFKLSCVTCLHLLNESCVVLWGGIVNLFCERINFFVNSKYRWRRRSTAHGTQHNAAVSR
jgi:hypothetical protein